MHSRLAASRQFDLSNCFWVLLEASCGPEGNQSDQDCISRIREQKGLQEPVCEPQSRRHLE